MSIELALLTRVAYRDQTVTGPRLRGLLALLATDLRTGCGTGRLVEGLWPNEQPERPGKALQVLVSRARSQLGADLIESTPTGYRLNLSEYQVDAGFVVRAAADASGYARTGEHAAALARADEALALWDSAPDGDAEPDDPVNALRIERLSTYRFLLRTRALALARTGRTAEAVDPLSSVAAEHPRDEEVLAELLRCEAATAGPAAALARYDSYRRTLRDELGTDPGPNLQSTYDNLLHASTPSVRQGIPHEPNQLLGRNDDIANVIGLLRDARVVSIVGTGGLGKTRLAQAIARQADHRVVHFVPLAGARSDADVVNEVATVLEVGEAWQMTSRGMTPPDVITGIVRTLGSGPALLVLDNCEHVVEGAADLVSMMVAATSHIQVLTTTRAPLGLSSESVYLLPELALRTATDLFEQRARAVRPDVELSPQPIAELCRHLDGLPLAVELAAARVRAMSVTDLVDRLQDRFALLRGASRDAPERHQTLYAVVDWSWNLLGPAEQRAMRVLSVFPDGFSADTAADLLDDPDAQHTLERLVEQSLLQVSDSSSGTRFRMLETVREFSAAEREKAGETETSIEGFLSWATEFGLAHYRLFAGSSLDLLSDERDNLMRALRYGMNRADGRSVSAAFAILGWLWFMEGKYNRVAELAPQVARVLSHYQPPSELVEITRSAATACATSAFLQGPPELRSLGLLRRLPPAEPTDIVSAISIVLTTLPDFSGPEPAALDRLCDSPMPLLAGVANAAATYVREQQGDLRGALTSAERMLTAAELEPTPWLLYLAHSRVGELCLLVEEGQRAKRHLDVMLGLIEGALPNPHVEDIRVGLAVANLQCRNVEEAERWLDMVPGPDDNSFGAEPFLLGVRAEIQLARGDIDEGLRTWREAVDTWRQHPGDTRTSTTPWTLETAAIAVIAHEAHDELELVDDVVEALPSRLIDLLEQPTRHPASYGQEDPICGAALLASGLVGLRRSATDPVAIRLVALAERFTYVRQFHPTMASERIRRTVDKTDRSAYDEAVSSYADLTHPELRATAIELVRPLVAHQ